MAFNVSHLRVVGGLNPFINLCGAVSDGAGRAEKRLSGHSVRRDSRDEGLRVEQSDGRSTEHWCCSG